MSFESRKAPGTIHVRKTELEDPTVKTRVRLACLALFLSLPALSPAQEEVGKREAKKIVIEWARHEKSPNYVIEHEKVIPAATVKKVADALEDVLAQYVLVFRFKPKEKLKVKFLDSRNTYHQEGGRPGAAGHFSPGDEYLVIQQFPFFELFPIVYHEALHQYLHFYVGRGVEIPIWFNEGLASYYEEIQVNRATKKVDYKLISNRKLRITKDKILTRSAIPLATLFEAKYDDFHDKEDGGKEGLCYDQSFAVIYFFMQGMGGKPVFQFAEELKQTKDPALAYEKILGKERKNLKAIEERWKQYIAQVKIVEKKA